MTREERKADAKKAYDALMEFYPSTLENLDGEKWADIAGYEGLYQISTFGRVKSFCRKSASILKPNVLRGGYLYVNLYKNHKKKICTIHRLVAEAFVPNVFGKPQVNHRVGCKFNCHVSNLEWATGSENERHAVETGLFPTGENNWQASLTNEQVEWCRAMYVPFDAKKGIAALARQLGKERSAVYRAVHGNTYKQSGGTGRAILQKSPVVPKEVRDEIKYLYQKGVKGCGAPSLAKEFGLGETTIYRIVKNK